VIRFLKTFSVATVVVIILLAIANSRFEDPRQECRDRGGHVVYDRVGKGGTMRCAKSFVDGDPR
jgi:hypothetical protein